MKLDPMIVYSVLLVLMVITSLFAVLARTLLKAAIALAIVSVILTLIMFKLSSPLAAVFELSVCAGLITVLFVSVISLTSRLTHQQIMEMTKDRLRIYAPLVVIVIIVGVCLFYLSGIPKDVSLTVPVFNVDNEVKTVLWNQKMTDLAGQIIILLTGVFGVVVLLKEAKRKND